MRERLKGIKELEELLLKCMKCGFCQGVCPLYQLDALEPSVARGKLALLEAIYQGRLGEAQRIIGHLEYCVLCRRCAENCPSGVDTDYIFFRAREILRGIKGLPWYQRFLLSTALKHSRLTGVVAALGGVLVRTGGKEVAEKVYQPLFYPRAVIPPAARPFIPTNKGWHRASHERDRVILYPGCAVNYIFHWWGDLALAYLTTRGVSVWVPPENICCGIPAGSMGQGDLMRELVKKNWEVMGEVEASCVVTLCPTCLYGLSNIGPKVAHIEPSLPVLDILQYVASKGLEGKIPLEDGPLTYHVPCHYPQPDFMADFLKNTFNGDWVALDNHGCCGFGGTFSLKNPHVSMDILLPKVSEIKEKGVKSVFTCCPGCAFQITQGLAAQGVGIRAQHPLEVMVENE